MKKSEIVKYHKNGKFVWCDGIVGKINYLSQDQEFCQVSNIKDTITTHISSVKSVNFRPWTRKEWESKIGTAFQFDDGMRMLLNVLNHPEHGYELAFLDICGGMYETIRQVNGLPCEEPEVEK